MHHKKAMDHMEKAMKHMEKHGQHKISAHDRAVDRKNIAHARSVKAKKHHHKEK